MTSNVRVTVYVTRHVTAEEGRGKMKANASRMQNKQTKKVRKTVYSSRQSMQSYILTYYRLKKWEFLIATHVKSMYSAVSLTLVRE